MNELKPTWRIAQQISKRHTLISLSISLPLIMGVMLSAIIILKILGFPHPGVTLKHYYDVHQKIITYLIVFTHLVPVNYYAVMRVFDDRFNKFQLKIVSK